MKTGFDRAQRYVERSGDVPDVVFPCGWILADDGCTIRLYYGAADTCIGLAIATVGDLVDACLNS